MLVPKEGVRVGMCEFSTSESTEAMLDFRRRPARRTLRILLRTVSRLRLEPSESDDDDELESESDESSQLAAGPGWDSASTMCWGVDSYM